MRLIATNVVTCLCVSLISHNALAACKQPVTYVLVSESAPCTGYLFSPEKEAELRSEHEKYNLNLEILSIKDQQINLYKQQTSDLQAAVQLEQQKAELWRKNAEDSTNKLMQSNERQGWRDMLFLTLGVVITAAAGWAVGQAHK